MQAALNSKRLLLKSMN